MAARTLTPSRALHRPHHIDLRAVLGLFILLVATVGAVAAWSGATSSRAVLSVTRDLPAGATLTSADLSVVRLHADAAVDAVALPASTEDQLIGRALAGPAYAHQVLVRAQISSSQALPPGQVAFSIPVSADSAVGGRLQAGDALRVYVTTAKGTPAAKTAVVVEQATVLNVGYDPQLSTVGAAGSASDSAGSAPPSAVRSLTLRVTPQQAQALAFARWNGSLDVALLPPNPSAPS
jgi:Flp pilus assembly protein CpaB